MRSPRLLNLVLALALAATASTAVAQDPEAIFDDPVLAGVVRMLDAELSDLVIRRWLDTQGAPAAPSADDLIALRAAGASDELLAAILDRALGVESVAEPTQAPPAPSRSASPSPSTTLEPAPAEVESALAASDGEPVPATFRLSYRPYYLEGEESWNLYAYLDGIPLTIVPESQPVGGRQVLTFDQEIAPGRHMLRFVRERHEIHEDGDVHSARAIEAMVVFEVRPGEGDLQVEARFDQSPIDFSDPIDVRVAQGGRTLDAREEIGGTTDSWRFVCEDAQASGEPAPLGCVRWRNLWPGIDVPPRHEVLRALAIFDYRPVPKTEQLF